MPDKKEALMRLAASGCLLLFGPIMIVSFNMCDLATAQGIVCIFVGTSAAYQASKDLYIAITWPDELTADDIIQKTNDLNLRVLIARERFSVYELERILGNRKQALERLELQLIQSELRNKPNPYRDVAN